MVMRKVLLAATLLLGVLSSQAQEKVMNIQKTDGTSLQARVADLKQISFLTVDEGGQGLILKTLGGEMATVLFEANPIVTVSSGRLSIKPSSESAIVYEITDIAEIVFGDISEATPISKTEGFAFVVQDGGALLRGIPAGTKPLVYSIDGRKLPSPPCHNGELRLSRETLGSGIFVVKVGTFSTKVMF